MQSQRWAGCGDGCTVDTCQPRPIKANRPVAGAVAGTFTKAGADAREDAIWSARRDTETGYGIAVFDLDPGSAHADTSITIRYYHAFGADRVPTSNYELFETLVLAKARRDSKRV